MSGITPERSDKVMDSSTQVHENLIVSFSSVAGRNPYQQLLLNHLEQLGVRVIPSGGLLALLRSRISGKEWPRIFHLQWIPRISSGFPGRLRAWRFVFALHLRRLVGQKIVWTVHNLHAHECAQPRLEKRLGEIISAMADRIIVHGETAVNLVREEFRVADTGKIVVIPHGNYIGSHPDVLTKEQARRELDLPADSTVFAFVGNIRPYKGVVPLVDAFRRIEEPSLRLVVAGSPMNDVLRRQIEEAAGSDNRIHLDLRWLSDHDVEVMLKASDLTVFPYQNILTSGAVILGMSYGRACLGPRLGCLPDVISDDGGFLYSINEPGELELALRRAFAERATLSDKGKVNMTRARSWGWDKVASMTFDQYLGALGQKRIELGEPMKFLTEDPS